MADKIAKVYTHVSNRAKKGKHGSDLEKKSVQKSVLDNPLRVDWPAVPTKIQNACYAHLSTCLQGLSEWRCTSTASKKRKRFAKGPATEESTSANVDNTIMDAANDVNIEGPSAASDFLNMSIGINAVTKRLEAQIAASRKAEKVDHHLPTLRLVFVCRHDVDPPLLVSHLPHLVAAVNSLVTTMPKGKKVELIKLVSLPKDSELQLSTLVGFRRMAVFAFQDGAPALTHLLPLVESVSTPMAPWLNAALTSAILLPTYVKQIRTTAPKDMKASKEQRAEGRAAAKTRKRIKIAASGTNR